MNIAILNVAAVVFAVVSFAAAYGLRAFALPRMSQWAVLLTAAGLCVAADLVWRWTKGKKHWFRPAGGGSICFLPLWAFAVLWAGKMAFEAYFGPIPHASLAGLR